MTCTVGVSVPITCTRTSSYPWASSGPAMISAMRPSRPVWVGRLSVTAVQKSNKKGGRLRATLEKSGFNCCLHTRFWGAKQAKAKKQPLFEKSGTKNLVMLGPDGETSTAQNNKVFLLLFVRKKQRFLFL